jgi:hypothetical protein
MSTRAFEPLFLRVSASALLLILGAGCRTADQKTSQPRHDGEEFVSAELYCGTRRAERRMPVSGSDVRKLSAAFPGLGTDHESPEASSFGEGWRIRFARRDGRVVWVVLDESLSRWMDRAGDGDWPLAPESAEIIRSIWTKGEMAGIVEDVPAAPATQK